QPGHEAAGCAHGWSDEQAVRHSTGQCHTQPIELGTKDFLIEAIKEPTGHSTKDPTSPRPDYSRANGPGICVGPMVSPVFQAGSEAIGQAKGKTHLGA